MDQDECLMAVLLGEPPSPEAGNAAEHAAAERDMAEVRGQLHLIGDGLARAAADPSRTPGRRRQRRGLLALAATVVAATLGAGAAYLAAHAGSPAGGGEGAKLTAEGLVACSTVIAEGFVTTIEPLDGKDKFKIVLDVEHSYKPEAGQTSLAFTAEGVSTTSYYKTGARVLVVVSRFPGEGPLTFRAGDPAPEHEEGEPGQARDALDWGRAWIQNALPGARGKACPGRG